MTEDNTSWTPSADENKLGLTDKNLINDREGDSRKIYIDAMKSADKGNFDPLTNLIRKELTAF